MMTLQYHIKLPQTELLPSIFDVEYLYASQINRKKDIITVALGKVANLQ